MNGESPIILEVKHRDQIDDIERYDVSLSDPSLSGAIPAPLQEVRTSDRKAIENRARQVIKKLSCSNQPYAPEYVQDLNQELKSLGRLLCTTFIPPDIRQALQGSRAPVVITTELNNLPWELLHLGDDNFLALTVPLVRFPPVKYTADALKEMRKERQLPIYALLACDPTLPMTEKELESLTELLQKLEVEVRRMGQDPRDRIKFLDDLAAGQFTLLHVASHGHFEPENPGLSSVCVLVAENKRESITAEDLYKNMAGAPIIFLNACESARENLDVENFPYLPGRKKGFATQVIAGGAIAFVGTQWPVLDLSAAFFGVAFYQRLLEGSSVGDAMLSARRVCADIKLTEDLRVLLLPDVAPETSIAPGTWANFVLYGSPVKQLITIELLRHQT